MIEHSLRTISVGIVLMLSVYVKALSSDVDKEVVIVDNGKPVSVIVLPKNATKFQSQAAFELQKIIKNSSLAEIPIYGEDKLPNLSGNTVKILIGENQLSRNYGYDVINLKPEEFRIIALDRALIILGDEYNSPDGELTTDVALSAVSYLADNYLGVRFLWPGELGTYIPEHKTISFPQFDIKHQPKLVKRVFRSRKLPEYLKWASLHSAEGSRVDYRFMHSFRPEGDNGDWWKMYRDTMPDLFAKDPMGVVKLRVDENTNRPENVHFYQLCISNPDVIEIIENTWKNAGMPDFWDITPNDGNGFCTCDNCRNLDIRLTGFAYTKEEIWNRPPYVELTSRYAWYWNLVLERLKKFNPNVKVGVQFYSAYRNPNIKFKLEKGIVGEMVHGFDFSLWEKWNNAGVEMIGLRPNWWHMGANAPHLPLQLIGKYIEKAREAGMVSIDMDTMVEYWATQGAYYYLVARLISRPDLNTDDVIEEYCSAFGSAHIYIKSYLEFWENYHVKVAYNIPAGGQLSQDSTGIYETICKEHFGEVKHPLVGHWLTMPYIYSDDILNTAKLILDSAENVLQLNEVKERQRIVFLRQGLNQVSLTNKIILSKSIEDKTQNVKNLKKFGIAMENEFGYWGSEGIWLMSHWGIIGDEIMYVDDM